ncbi:MAG: hypothetical protein ABSB89_03900 [Candidatus Bathyarchaeia archaeon]
MNVLTINGRGRPSGRIDRKPNALDPETTRLDFQQNLANMERV